MNLGSETIHIRLYILTFSYILLIMCFALYVAKKNRLANETPMHGTRTGCMAIYKKTDHVLHVVGGWWSVVWWCGLGSNYFYVC